MDVAAYLDRIGFAGTARPDFDTLTALHRAHLKAIPFENIDVQLKRPLGVGIEEAYDKIVRRRRGGWCFEMNGLMGWALRELGFDVTRLTASVMRESGDGPAGNHLCLNVWLAEPWLVDVGFGGSLHTPLQLRRMERTDAPFRVALDETANGGWRYTEQAHGDPFSFDFRDQPADEPLMARTCQQLQTDPASPFVRNLVVQQRSSDTHFTLRGRVFEITTPARRDKRLVNSADELVAVLRERFALDVPEAASLWPAIEARHAALFPAG
ncbi:MAG: arylamine N-acetyltransferase [Hyphomonadaceae bacterium]|nr:arylamine N-acetyltransferase [Hyphomonadaceae bacterium]